MNVRCRGIYTTALTNRFLDAGHDVVAASDPIRERFDADFGAGPHDVTVETTDDRQGVGATGDPDAVARAVDVLDRTRDTLAWPSPAPRGAVFDARVTETLGSGAVCDLGETEGFLPFGAVDAHVDVGDAVRVQVAEATAPWADRRPVLDGGVCVRVGLATLVRDESGVSVDARDDEAARELAGMTDLLDVDPPDGWGLVWTDAATDADVRSLATALERATDRADTLDDALGAPADAPRRLVTPTATTWVWFGRETRFALDDDRRAVTTTMPGHHRVKAASSEASRAVDFVEALGSHDGEFDFVAVTDTFGPVAGDHVRLDHGKPDGRRIVLGRAEVLDRDADGTLTLRREMTAGGTYDALGVDREAGDVAITKVREGRWWYPTVYRDADATHKGTYVNVCTPVECFPDAVRYVDLHVDVVKAPDGETRRVDDDELDDAVAAGLVSESLAAKARSVATSLEAAL
jgi:Ribonuclease G/E